MERQKGYLEAHGIIALPDGITFAINPDGIDFQYVLKIGKGIWSTANVDVTAPLPPPHPPSIPSPHAGDLLFQDNFEGYLPPGFVWTMNFGNYLYVDLGAKWSVENTGRGRIGVGPSHFDGTVGHFDVPAPTSGDFWLDTKTSDSGINISSSFTDPTGGKFLLEFDISAINTGHPTKFTSPNATLEVRIGREVEMTIGTPTGDINDRYGYAPVQVVKGYAEDVVKTITMSDVLPNDNVMKHVSLVVDLGKPDGVPVQYKISLVDTPQDATTPIGFAVDTIQIHDWIT